MDPDENPFLYWNEHQRKVPTKKQEDLVQRFKSNPDSFFPSIIPPIKPNLK